MMSSSNIQKASPRSKPNYPMCIYVEVKRMYRQLKVKRMYRQLKVKRMYRQLDVRYNEWLVVIVNKYNTKLFKLFPHPTYNNNTAKYS